jgi:hypothetical protein
VTSEFLDCARRRAPHREVQTERVPQDVNASVLQIREPRGAADEALDMALGERLPVSLNQHAWTLQVTVTGERGREPARQRNAARAATFRTRDVSLPLGSLDEKLTVLEIDVGQAQGRQLAESKARVSRSENDEPSGQADRHRGLDESLVFLEVMKARLVLRNL